MAGSALTCVGGLLLTACVTLTGCASSTTPAAGDTTATAPTSVAAASPTSAPTTGTATTTAGDSPSRTAPPGSGAVLACANTDLTVTVSPAGVGLGHVGSIIVFTNGSEHRCSLRGYPGVAGLDSAGRQVTQALRSPSGYLGGSYTVSVVVLAPGGRASALVEGTDVPTSRATSCPIYPRLLVTAPGQTRSHVLAAGTSGCSPLQVHPVVAGAAGRA
jgi:Protein of unknown function (DUF4232)